MRKSLFFVTFCFLVLFLYGNFIFVQALSEQTATDKILGLLSSSENSEKITSFQIPANENAMTRTWVNAGRERVDYSISGGMFLQIQCEGGTLFTGNGFFQCSYPTTGEYRVIIHNPEILTNALYLNSRKITSFRWGNAKQLTALSLAGNPGIFLHEKSLEKLTNVISLNLSLNKLSVLPVWMIPPLLRLEYFDVHWNELRDLPSLSPSIRSLMIDGNCLWTQDVGEDTLNFLNSRLGYNRDINQRLCVKGVTYSSPQSAGITSGTVQATVDLCGKASLETFFLEKNPSLVHMQFTTNGTQTLDLTSAISGELLLWPKYAVATVDWIDALAPHATQVIYNPATFTTGSVAVTLMVNEQVRLPADWIPSDASGQVFTKHYTGNVQESLSFSDLAGNQWSTGILITRTAWDRDGDGVPDYIEYQEGTDPNDPTSFKDSDKGGVPDYIEGVLWMDPLNPADDRRDSDGDGVPDYIEYIEGTNPRDSSSRRDENEHNGRADYLDPPFATRVRYTPEIQTAGNVQVTLTTNKTVKNIFGWTRQNPTTFTKVYTTNTSEVVTFVDLKGLSGFTGVNVYWITGWALSQTANDTPWNENTSKKDTSGEWRADSQTTNDTPRNENTTNKDPSGEWESDVTDFPALYSTMKCSILGSPHSYEETAAYLYVCEKDFSTQRTIHDARLSDYLTRAEMAKIVVQYLLSETDKKADMLKDCSAFSASIARYNDEMKNYMTLACQLGVMGVRPTGAPLPDFMPDSDVTRAEFGTVFSRILRGSTYEGNDQAWYQRHLQALKDNNIITNGDPMIKELRARVFLQLYRAAQRNE